MSRAEDRAASEGAGPRFEVDLPSGGRIELRSADEQELWNESAERYQEEYVLNKHNDLILLGAILQQQVLMFRAQRALNAVHVTDMDMDAEEREEAEARTVALTKAMNQAANEITRLERALGIDKATRESGGSHTVEDRIRTLKRAAHERGIHIVQRTLEFERFVNDLSWRVRMLNNADAEDQAYHDLSPEKLVAWLTPELERLAQIDKDFARDKGKLYAGKL